MKSWRSDAVLAAACFANTKLSIDLIVHVRKRAQSSYSVSLCNQNTSTLRHELSKKEPAAYQDKKKEKSLKKWQES